LKILGEDGRGQAVARGVVQLDGLLERIVGHGIEYGCEGLLQYDVGLLTHRRQHRANVIPVGVLCIDTLTTCDPLRIDIGPIQRGTHAGIGARVDQRTHQRIRIQWIAHFDARIQRFQPDKKTIE
jgi:hypothetical protein